MWDIKQKTFFTATVNTVGRLPTEWEKICANNISNKPKYINNTNNSKATTKNFNGKRT